MVDTNKMALLGIDVGFSARRPTTGIAWCVDDEFGARKTHTDWERRRAVIPAGVEFTIVAVDGPLPPSDAPADIYRGCERTFVRGPFAARCKPGLSHIGYGRRLRTAALETALDACSLLSHTARFSGPHVISGAALVEAFPNAFLGVLLPDDVYVAGGFKKRKKFDWLYDHAVRLGNIDLVFEHLGWNRPKLLAQINDERDHERRAAWICLLTAALAHAGKSEAVGDAVGGWFWLPPLELWSPWAQRALADARG